MRREYDIETTWGETIRMRADLASASAPIEVHGEDGWVVTPYTTADARHDQRGAAMLILDPCDLDGLTASEAVVSVSIR